jgi:hypothetical protein
MRRENGFAALFLVVTLLVMSVLFSVSILTLSVGEGQSSLALFQGTNALYLAESCAEDVLLRIRNDETFSDARLTLPEGSCELSFSGDSSDQRITVVGEKDGYARTIDIRVHRTLAGLQLESWSE